MSNKKAYELYTDGACTGKTGKMGIGYSIQNGNELLKTYSKGVGYGDANEAKYIAIIEGIKAALKYKPKEIYIFSSSQLVINQINRKWKVNQGNLKKRYAEVEKLKRNKKCRLNFIWKKKEDIIIADFLASNAIGKKTK